MKPIKWVKVPGPGEFRGEGKWMSLAASDFSEVEWDDLLRTGYLPTAEQVSRPD